MKRAEVTTLIKKAVRDFGLTPAQINNGNCDEFAGFLLARFPGFRYEVSAPLDPFTHDWVSHRGIHYDAETPEGVRTREEIGTKPAYRKREVGVKDDRSKAEKQDDCPEDHFCPEDFLRTWHGVCPTCKGTLFPETTRE